MKYKVNEAHRVNTDAAKSGIKWRYAGKTENPESTVDRFHKRNENGWLMQIIGIRITDENGKIVYEEML